ncbi:MAG: glycosyltransferase family 4 protein [Phycisphaerales bacterium]|nr:MAG: glycosyltransferase family 4 protein [Phycisphaerales bacterium]
MRILEVIQDGRFGGIAARALPAALALRQRGVDTVFLVSTGGGDVARRCAKLGFRVVRVPLRRPHPRRLIQTLLWFGSFPVSVWKLCCVMRAEAPDIVHANGMICLQAVVASLFVRLPLVWHFAGTNMYPQALSRAVVRCLGRSVCKVFIARSVRQYFLGDSPTSSRERIIHEPVDVDLMDKVRLPASECSFRQAIGVPPEASLVCTVANITSLKGIDVLLDAAKTIHERHPETYFVVVGEKLQTQGKYIAALERDILAAGITSHFILAGARTDVYRLLRECDVFVLPSLSEGTPISILEAMAIGIPVVATTVGGIPEQIGHRKSGLLVPPADARALAEAIEELLVHPELRAELAHQANEHVRAKFSLDQFCDSFLDVVRACTDSHPEELPRAISERGVLTSPRRASGSARHLPSRGVTRSVAEPCQQGGS